MMARRLFVLSSVLLQLSCVTSSVSNSPVSASDEPQPIPTYSTPLLQAVHEVVDEKEVHIRLSKAEIQDGSLLAVKVTPPLELKGKATEATASITVKMAVPRNPELVTKELNFPLIPNVDGTFQTYLAIPYGMPAGEAQLKITVINGENKKTAKADFLVSAGEYPSESLKVKPKHVSPSPKDMPRIQKDNELITKAYHRMTLKRYWTKPFRLPIKSVVTSPYGSKRVYNGNLENFHGGLDLRAKKGTKIFAPAPGEVVVAKNMYYTGKTVLIDHGYGLISLYGHMNKISVKVGQKLKTGNLIGLSGMTGRANGPHLHWQTVLYGIKFNPLDLTQAL